MMMHNKPKVTHRGVKRAMRYRLDGGETVEEKEEFQREKKRENKLPVKH